MVEGFGVDEKRFQGLGVGKTGTPHNRDRKIEEGTI